MVTVATYNLENLFSRPKAFNTGSWAEGEKILAAYRKFNTLIAAEVYSDTDKVRMRELLVKLGVYYRNTHGAIRRRLTQNPAWAWLRKNRGSFDTEPRDTTKDVQITATGRGDWIGWLELATEATDEIGTRMTARVIHDVDADILAVVEAEDRPSLLRLNAELLDRHYRHIMLVDGNDERGIDVGIMAKTGFRIGAIRSHVDAEDNIGIVFSRDCPDYQITTPTGATIHLLVNHFKSQSGGGGPKRLRQAAEVRRLADELVDRSEHVIVLGDLNEGQPSLEEPAPNLAVLFDPDGPLVSCFDLGGFDVGKRPGTYGPCTIRNRLDYIFISRSLVPAFTGGRVFRDGLWGSRKTRPTDWDTYPEMTSSAHQASDHAAVIINLDL
jgi:endonuclease/exonuclease/phosphatase family metal-dependent hydrolase